MFSKSTLKPWELEIVNKYPFIYLEGSEEYKKYYEGETCNLRYNFEFDSGWAALVEEFSETAQNLVLHLRNTVQPDAYIHSCIFKEKFGRLTWQGKNNLIEPFGNLFNGYTYYIENKSLSICEITGKYGKLRKDCKGGYLWKTLCDEEYEKYK